MNWLSLIFGNKNTTSEGSTTTDGKTIIFNHIGKAIAALIFAAGAAFLGLNGQNLSLFNKPDTDKNIIDANQKEIATEPQPVKKVLGTKIENSFFEIKNARIINVISGPSPVKNVQRWLVKLDNNETFIVFHNSLKKVPAREGDIIDAAGELFYDDSRKQSLLRHTDAASGVKPGYIILKNVKYD